MCRCCYVVRKYLFQEKGIKCQFCVIFEIGWTERKCSKNPYSFVFHALVRIKRNKQKCFFQIVLEIHEKSMYTLLLKKRNSKVEKGLHKKPNSNITSALYVVYIF